MNTYIALLINLFVLLAIGTGCVDESKKIWGGIIYPAGIGAPNMKFDLGNYETLEQCRDATKIKLKAMRIESSGDYQCRKNCKTDDYGNEECEETVR